MTATSKILIAHQNVENAQTTKYTSPVAASGGKGTWIDKFTATNYSAGVQTISVNLVTVGDVAGNGNLVVKTRSLAAGETYFFPELVGKFLGPGDFISWVASAAASISAGANGREVT